MWLSRSISSALPRIPARTAAKSAVSASGHQNGLPSASIADTPRKGSITAVGPVAGGLDQIFAPGDFLPQLPQGPRHAFPGPLGSSSNAQRGEGPPESQKGGMKLCEEDWGTADLDKAMDTAVAIINGNAAKIDGVKVSLLDKQREIDMRRRLDKNVKMYTGDDFNYAELIAGDEAGHSDALLGIFDAIAPAASAALAALGRGSENEFFELLEPTVPLSRHIFAAPTRFYKTGVVFLAYLNGLQDHFLMIGGQQSARSLVHLAELFRLADEARVLRDPDLAAHRMRQVLSVGGIN